jgi:hypothetical protein
MPALKLSTLIDRYYKQQEAVKLKSRDVTRAEAARDKEKAKLAKIGDQILDRFKNDEVHGFKTALAQAELKTVTSASIKDWKKLTAYVKRTGSFALFQRRINKATWLEHIDARKGKPVPGVASFKRVTLSVTKRK